MKCLLQFWNRGKEKVSYLHLRKCMPDFSLVPMWNLVALFSFFLHTIHMKMSKMSKQWKVVICFTSFRDIEGFKNVDCTIMFTVCVNHSLICIFFDCEKVRIVIELVIISLGDKPSQFKIKWRICHPFAICFKIGPTKFDQPNQLKPDFDWFQQIFDGFWPFHWLVHQFLSKMSIKQLKMSKYIEYLKIYQKLWLNLPEFERFWVL